MAELAPIYRTMFRMKTNIKQQQQKAQELRYRYAIAGSLGN